MHLRSCCCCYFLAYTSIKLRCLVTEVHVPEQLQQGRYLGIFLHVYYEVLERPYIDN